MSFTRWNVPDGAGASVALLVLRVGTGLGLLLLHGSGKLAAAVNHVLHGQEWGFVNLVGSIGFPLPLVFALAATLAESLGALLLVAGLATRPAAAIVALTMTVAIHFHLKAGQSAEMAFLYLLLSLSLAIAGGGVHSLDQVWAESGRARKKGVSAMA